MTPSRTTRFVPFRASSSMVMVTPTWGTWPPVERSVRTGWDMKWVKSHLLLQVYCLTCKKPTVIHFLLLLSFFYFLIYFLFFSSDRKTQNKQSWLSIQLNLLPSKFFFIWLTSKFLSVTQVQHPLESKDPTKRILDKILQWSILQLSLFAFDVITYWVSETVVKALHTKIQQLLLLQWATDISDNLLWQTHK